MAKAADVRRALQKYATPAGAKASAWFFKTGPGEYGEGDVFIGVKVPQQRLVAKHFADLTLPEIDQLLRSKVHEHRLTVLFILYQQFLRADERRRKVLIAFLLKHMKYVNNWDMIDTAAGPMLGLWLLDKPRAVLYRLARSKNIWERRLAIMATQRFIPHRQYADTLRLTKMLLQDKHDLIHKAVGWMLREVGNKDQIVEEKFLNQYAKYMPRTMLRYAIEKFPEQKRQRYLRT